MFFLLVHLPNSTVSELSLSEARNQGTWGVAEYSAWVQELKDLGHPLHFSGSLAGSSFSSGVAGTGLSSIQHTSAASRGCICYATSLDTVIFFLYLVVHFWLGKPINSVYFGEEKPCSSFHYSFWSLFLLTFCLFFLQFWLFAPFHQFWVWLVLVF